MKRLKKWLGIFGWVHNDATIQRYYTRMSLYPNRMETVKNGSQVGSSSQIVVYITPWKLFFLLLAVVWIFQEEKEKGRHHTRG